MSSLSQWILLALCGALAFSNGNAQTAPHRFAGYRAGFNRDTLALQVLLDRQHLSCNCVDGVWGARTEIALVTWQTLNGLPPTGIPDAAVLAALVFGASNALKFQLQALNTGIPSQFLVMLPYIITILALCGLIRRSNKPASSAIPYVKE